MRERGQALVLTGFMGTGKSSVGREIARMCAAPIFDTDKLLVERFGMPVSRIFEQDGEPRFRDAESEIVAELRGDRPCVIVTGGGAVLRASNVEMLRALGTVIALTAEPDVIFERVSRRPSRPLLQTADPRATIELLLAEREPLYRDAADHVIDTSALSHADVAHAAIRAWQQPAPTASRQ